MWKMRRWATCVRMRRALAVYISQRDMAQLFIKSIETEDIRDELGLAVPDLLWNQRQPTRYLEHRQCPAVSSAMRPQDNSEERFFELIQAHMRAARII